MSSEVYNTDHISSLEEYEKSSVNGAKDGDLSPRQLRTGGNGKTKVVLGLELPAALSVMELTYCPPKPWNRIKKGMKGGRGVIGVWKKM